MYSDVKDVAVSGELDEVMCFYREKLRTLSSLWAGIACNESALEVSQLIHNLEKSFEDFVDQEVKVERAKYDVDNVQLVLDVSRQTIDDKTQHLDIEDKQKEEEQNARYCDFKQIHRLQKEKAEIEMDLNPAKMKLAEVIESLQEKREKMRNLELFHNSVAQHCVDDIMLLQEERETARNSKASWDSPSANVGSELAVMISKIGDVSQLENSVGELRRDLHNHRVWHEEELKTKLYISTRNKELKHKIAYFNDILGRIEKQNGKADIQRLLYNDNDTNKLSRPPGRFPENVLSDSLQTAQAKQDERLTGTAVGAHVLADYTMLHRLRQEIGAPGLAYLVEKSRLQGPGGHQGATGRRMEEQEMQRAVDAIVMEYRNREENKRLIEVPGIGADRSKWRGSFASDLSDVSEIRDRDFGRGVSPISEVTRDPKETSGSESSVSYSSKDTGGNSAASSSSSILRRGSMKIKKLLKR